MTQKEIKTLKKDVDELLNKALVLLKDIPDVEFDDNYDDGYSVKGSAAHRDRIFDYAEDKKDAVKQLKDLPSEDVVELSCLKEIIKELVDGWEEHMVEQYYTSNC